MLFLGKNYVFIFFLAWRGNSTEPLLNLRAKAPFLFRWVDVQGYLFTFVRELLLTLCAPVRSKMVIIFLALFLSKDTVQPGGKSHMSVITSCSQLKVLEVMWLQLDICPGACAYLVRPVCRKTVIIFLALILSKNAVQRVTEAPHTYSYSTLVASHVAKRKKNKSAGPSPEGPSGQRKELICYVPLLWRECLCPIARNGLVQ